MSNDFVRVPPDDTGKRLDAERVTVDATTVYRERMQLTGAADVEIARIVATDPAATDHGLVVRLAPPVSPVTDSLFSANLSPGASVNLDGTTIAAANTGKLLQVTVGSSTPAKWEIKTRDGAVEVTVAVLFTAGIHAGQASFLWTASSKEAATLAGNGVDENFRVTVTNLSDDTQTPADVYATIEWDEV